MDNRHSKGTEPERRVSLRQSRTVSVQNGHDGLNGLDLDDDEDYGMFGGMVADGFRPQHPNDGGYQAPSFPSDPSGRPDSSIFQNDRSTYRPESVASMVSPMLPRTESSSSPRPAAAAAVNRSSISKPPRNSRDSFTLRHDGGMGTVQASGSDLSRVSSTSTESPYITNETPYQGPTAPSHNYQNYPQDTRVARTMSVATTATTSTVPQPRESLYDGPRGPSHPYSMYPQNPVAGPSSDPPVPTIPVGFSGAGDQYQRRIGPEGEEIADMIGPDGHTEELPPYTRYPDEAYVRKIRDNESPPEADSSPRAFVAVASPVVVPVATMSAIPGAGGIGLASRNPEFDSAESVNSPQSRHSSRSFTGDSHHEINTAAAAMSEKKELNKYQKLAKKKACGVVPYWALCLTGFAVVAVAVIVGAVFSTVFAQKHKKPPQSSSSSSASNADSPTVTVTFDATPIPTPTDLPNLPSGTYGLPLTLNKSPNTCFNDTTQTQAWACNIIFGFASQMALSITQNAPQLGKPGNYDVFINSNESLTIDGDVLAYGAQPPVMDPPMPMELVNDTFDISRGPAWFRMLPYNKTVIVQEGSLSATTTTSKGRRSVDGFMPGPGDFKRKGVAQAGDKPWICTWPDTFIEVFIYALQNSSYSAQTGTITVGPTATATLSSTISASSGTSSSDMVPIYTPLPAYPRAIKMKERRVSGAPMPYCVQVEVQADNSTTTAVKDADGEPVKIYIVENEPGPAMVETQNKQTSHGYRDKRDSHQTLYGRDDDDGDMSNCGCMWFSS